MANSNDTSKSSVAESAYHLFSELTDRQYKALELFSCGIPHKQLSSMLGISTGTVKGHLEVSKDKLGCSNTAELRLIFFTRLMKHLCKRNELEPGMDELPLFVPKNVRVIPQETYWDMCEKSDYLRESLQLLEHIDDLPAAVKNVLSTCASWSGFIDNRLQDMSTEHAEHIECEVTFTLNNLIQEQLENDE